MRMLDGGNIVGRAEACCPISVGVKRGSILVYSLLIMSVMLAVGLSMNTLFLRNLRNVGTARESIIALYAADSGTELCLYEWRARKNDDAPLQPDASFTITNTDDGSLVTDDCSTMATLSAGFRTLGKFRRASRALEISF